MAAGEAIPTRAGVLEAETKQFAEGGDGSDQVRAWGRAA
jgi:hypothetical protein